jgi:hypothetical protein
LPGYQFVCAAAAKLKASAAAPIETIRMHFMLFSSRVQQLPVE